MNGQALSEHLGARTEEMLARLARLVEHESPSRDKEALDRLAGDLLARLDGLGADVRLVANPAGGDHVQARLFDRTDGTRPGLVLCHYDTVWPAGTLAERPFRVADGRAY